MDTAAAAAAAVVVDLSSESSTGKSKLVNNLNSNPSPQRTFKPAAAKQPIYTSVLTDHDHVESMSATPPPTPAMARVHCTSNEMDPDPAANGDAQHSLNCKDTSSMEHSQTELATSTSSINTSTSTTLPTPALLTSTATTTAASTAVAVAVVGATSTATTTTTTETGTGTSTIGTTPLSNASSPTSSMGQLLHWQDMPKYLQFNPYVLNGYRPLQTFKGCLLSLFYWHNETINILTHAIPIFYILAIVPGLMPWDSGYKFLSFCHVFGSVAPWCGSFVYHLFMNIEKGENVYYTLLKLDMVGIWVSQSFGALPLVTATTLCFTPILKWFIIISYCVLSLWGLYKALTASSPWQRRLCFALPFGMRSILTFMRIRGMVGGSHMALSHVYLQDGVSILGGAIGAMRIPEKWFPGVVDFYLNSHNIMHVLVVVAVYSMHKATIKDFEWMSTQTCNAIGNATEQTLGDHVEL